jgi:CRISPR-associated protein Cmr3
MVQAQAKNESKAKEIRRDPFRYCIRLTPLGHLYGSAGPFLSPDTLVGKAGRHFPPSVFTFAGLVTASKHAEITQDEKYLHNYQFAGPFWAEQNNPVNIYVPTPLNCLVTDNKIKYQLAWHPARQKWQAYIDQQWQTAPDDKYQTQTWLPIDQWQKLHPTNPEKPTIKSEPWQFNPHLHPELGRDQRITVEGRLFLENTVELDPNYCLVYLCNHAVEPGWYRFGGEGHLVSLTCQEIPPDSALGKLLVQPCDRAFATITPAVWGSNRRSLRSPQVRGQSDEPVWPHPNPHQNPIEITTLLTAKPIPIRHRLGRLDPQHTPPDERVQEPPRLLSRGRYAVPPGAIYILAESLNLPWQNWPDHWFPKEGYSYQQFGTGLALPLDNFIIDSDSEELR